MSKILPLAVCALILASAGAGATEFTTERLLVKDGHHLRATLYCRPDMWRIEHNTSSPVDVTIVRRDKGVVWHLMARTKRYIALPLDPHIGPTCQQDLAPENHRDLIGTETLQGRPTTVSEVTVREGNQDVSYYEWRADDVQLPLRLARKDGTWFVDYTHLRVTRLAGYLFELPSHYRPLTLR
jgi:hypothetical protein